MAGTSEDQDQALLEAPVVDDQQTGQGLVEYAFILVLIVLVLILIVTILGKQTNNMYSNISNAMPR